MPREGQTTVQIGPRIDKQLWTEFKEFVEEKHGKTSGVTAVEVEKALRRHVGEDPLQQVDERLRTLESKVGADSSDSVGTRETVSNDPANGQLNARTQNRVDAILDQLPARFDSDQLDAAIENVAGSSYKTINRYREILTKRNKVVQAPWNDAETFYQDRRMFSIAAVENLDQGDLYNLQDRLAVHWGDNWLTTSLPDDMPDPFDGYEKDDGGRRGFE